MIHSYEALDKLETFSNEDIIQFYHNAYETQCMSLGHYKGQMNEGAKMGYAEELKRRGITKIPKRQGVFNGNGTY
tara:strand:+ start:1605 stop:1829 length:225 start_codon:yes stop_codon:yes gene_type:complete